MKIEKCHDREVIETYLSEDVFQNLMSLKMLSLFPKNCECVLYHSGTEWACRICLDPKISGWNRVAYPEANQIILLDGNSPLLLQYANATDAAPRTSVVFKVHDKWSRESFKNDSRYVLANSFLSYSSLDCASVAMHIDTEMVERHNEYNDNAAEFFAASGYGKDEFQLHMSRGAQWFSISDNKKLLSACFVYQNHANIWEIGGVMTLPMFRGQEYATKVVSAALKYLSNESFIPRYQFSFRNIASQNLAEKLGLELKLTVEHYVNVEQKFVKK